MTAFPTLPASMPVPPLFQSDDSVAARDLANDVAHSGLRYLPMKAPLAPDAYNLAAVNIVKLPDAWKALHVKSAYVRTVSGGAVLGALTDKGDGVLPTTGTFSRSPCGDLQFLATDAATLLDVEFQPANGDVVEYGGAVSYLLALPVNHTTGLCALPAALTTPGVIMLLEAELLTVGAGGVAGKKIILVEGTAPATTYANLNVARSGVFFPIADVGASDGVARVKVLIGRPQA